MTTRDEYKRDHRLLAGFTAFLAFTVLSLAEHTPGWMSLGLIANALMWLAAIASLYAELAARRRQEAKEVPHAGGVSREK